MTLSWSEENGQHTVSFEKPGEQAYFPTGTYHIAASESGFVTVAPISSAEFERMTKWVESWLLDGDFEIRTATED